MTFNARSLISIKPPSPLTAAAVFVFSKLCSANSRAFRALVIFAERSFTISKKSLLVLVMFRPEYICPHCGAGLNKEPLKLVKRDWPEPWRRTRNAYDDHANFVRIEDLAEFYDPNEIAVRICSACGGMSLFIEDKIVWPVSSGIRPYEKMPEKAKQIFNEAQSLMRLSPRSCCALLRLCVEEIVNYVAAKQGLKNFDPNWMLVRRIDALAPAIPETLTQQLTACRVIGNDAAHPGVIDFSGEDSGKVAVLLSHAVNNLCACLIGPLDLKKLADEVEAERKARKNKS